MLDENYQQNTGPAKFLKYCSYVQRGWVGAGTVKTKMEQERSLTKKNCCLAMFFFGSNKELAVVYSITYTLD